MDICNSTQINVRRIMCVISALASGFKQITPQFEIGDKQRKGDALCNGRLSRH